MQHWAIGYYVKNFARADQRAKVCVCARMCARVCVRARVRVCARVCVKSALLSENST